MDKKCHLDVVAFQRQYLTLLVDDIPEERLTEQPAGVPNHPAWQIGHLAWAADGFAAEMGAQRTIESWNEKFGQGSKPVATRSAYPSKQELLRIYDDRLGALTARVLEASEAELNSPPENEALRGFFPTRSRMLTFFLHFHEGAHFGQIAAWRKAAGLPEALSKMAR